MWKRSTLIFSRAIILMLVAMVVFSAGPFVNKAEADGWAGWNAIDTIYYDPAQDDAANGFIEQAATELRDHLQQASKTLTITTASRPGSGSIYLDVDPANVELADREEEAFKLYSDTNGIYITGKTPIAVRHGAYTLLEKLGFRWFFKHPAWTVCPDSLVSLDGLSEVQEPFYFWRFIEVTSYVGADETAAWVKRNRTFGAKYYPVYHSYARIIDRSEYDEHPEWFLPEGRYPSYPWQLRPDNPDVVARAIDYAHNYLSTPAHSHDILSKGSVPISPNDGTGWDPPWEPWENWQTITDKVYYLANEVAKSIKDDFPDRYVGVYAYTFYGGVPTFEVEPNILVMIATDYNYTPLTLVQQIDGLRDKGVTVGIRDYLDIWTWFKDSPIINFETIERLAWYANKGVRAYDGEAGDGWAGKGGLTCYLVSKLLWNPNAGVDNLLDDFYTKAFGPAKYVMKDYYEVRNTDNASLATSFRDLDQAESLAAGNEEVLERIRQLEYYNRYVWFWKNKGIVNLSLDELKDFYTFVTKLRDLYVIYYYAAEDRLREELQDRGLSDSEIDALQDFTPPTEEEARVMMDEALSAFEEFTIEPSPYVNPREIELSALGDNTKPALQPLYGNYRTILVPSPGNEDVTVMVKGYKGLLQWYHPTTLLLDSWSFSSTDNLIEWTPVTFRADSPGTYILHITRAFPNGSEKMWVDVPNRPASIIADPTNDVFDPEEPLSINAPTYLGYNEQYFYVPQDTDSFSFGADVSINDPDRHAHGELTDPDGIVYPFDFGVTSEIAFDSPTPGIWQINIDMPTNTGRFWLIGIPPLVWHDPQYLLVASTEANNPPVADDQSITTDEDSSVSITLTASDSDGDTLSYAIVNNPTHGTLSGTAPELTYTPDSDYNGTDTFTFIAVDGKSISNSATVTITINPVNDAPIANNQSVITIKETPISINLGASDPDDDPLTYAIVDDPVYGALSGTIPNLTYTPEPEFSGTDNFTFTASDGTVTSNTASCLITVRQGNNPPVADNQNLTINENSYIYIILTASDLDDDPLTYNVTNSPTNGTLSGTIPELTYTPAAGFIGTDNFTFTASDGFITSNSASVNITVNHVNTTPVANNQRVTTIKGTSTPIHLIAHDADGDTLTYAIVTEPLYGELSGTLPQVTYMPLPEFSGTDNFTFTVSDGVDTSDLATVTITIIPINSINNDPALPPSTSGGWGGDDDNDNDGARSTSVILSRTKNGTFLEDIIAQSMDNKIEIGIQKHTIGLNKNGQPLVSISIKVRRPFPEPPPNCEFVGKVYEIEPSGTSFEPSVDLIFRYTDTEVPQGVSEEKLMLATYDWGSEQWQELGSTVDPEGNSVRTRISHLSTYAVLAHVRPASFQAIPNLAMASGEVEFGSELEISVQVTNTGDLKGSHEIVLQMDSEVLQTKGVTLEGGGSEIVGFTVTPETAGEHQVCIEGSVAVFTVKESPNPIPFTTSELIITPTEINIGDSVNVGVLVTSTSDVPGTYEVILQVDDIPVQTKEVTLEVGGSETVSFTVIHDTAGQHTVNINGSQGMYEVTDPSAATITDLSQSNLEINSFSVVPEYDISTGKLVSAKIVYLMNEPCTDFPDAELTLNVFFNSEHLETLPLLNLSQLASDGKAGSLAYIPSSGWMEGQYAFQIELDEGQGQVQSTETEQFAVTSEVITKTVSLWILGTIICAAVFGISAIVLIILCFRREILKGYIN